MNNIIFSNQCPALPQPNKNANINSHSSKNKLDIKKMKSNTIKSLNDVEAFLNDFQRFKKYIKLYKILK